MFGVSDICPASFILTMWYVNLNGQVTVYAKHICFILTMWYVNNTLLTEVTKLFNGFYINYVICK